jgi:hypothetical protein
MPDTYCPLMVNWTMDLARRQSTRSVPRQCYTDRQSSDPILNAGGAQCLDAARRLPLPGELRFLRWLAGAAGLLRRLQASRWPDSPGPPDPPVNHQRRPNAVSGSCGGS